MVAEKQRLVLMGNAAIQAMILPRSDCACAADGSTDREIRCSTFRKFAREFMQIESIDQASAYIDEHGESKVREQLASGMMGNEKRARAFLDAEFKRRADDQGLASAIRAAQLAAMQSARAARWTMVAGFSSLLGALLQFGQFAMPVQRASWEHMAQCHIDASRDLANKTSGDQNERGITRGDYISDCMLSNGFAFQDGVGQTCQTSDSLHKSVKQIIPSCYQRRSFWSRLRTHWEGW